MKILQLSDIHWSKTSSMLDEYKNLRDDMEEYLEAYRKKYPEKFDYIFICGDIAFSGEKEQYEKAKAYITRLCEIVGCTTSEVLMVPGNHDKYRDSPPKILRESIDELMGQKHFDSDGMLDNALQTKMNSCKFLFEPFQGYDKFSAEFGSREPMMAKMLGDKPIDAFVEAEDKMYWTRELTDNLNGFKVIAYGVNTAFICDSKDYDFSKERQGGHKMFLSKFAYNEPRCKSDCINIFMAHHPIVFLANGDKIEETLDKRFQIQFFGHVHRADSDANRAVHIFSGALQPPVSEAKNADYKPVFNIVNIDVENVSNYENNLVVNLEVIAWNGEQFEKDMAKSKPLSLNMKARRNETKPIMDAPQYPVGVTKNRIQIRFLKYPLAEDIINEMAPGLYNDEIVDYINRLKFLEYIDSKKLWTELWNKMNEYEG